MATRLEEIRAYLDRVEEWARETPDWPSWDEGSLRDARALLSLAEEVRHLREPSVIDRHGRVVCLYCHEDLILANHSEDCPWLQVALAYQALTEAPSDEVR